MILCGNGLLFYTLLFIPTSKLNVNHKRINYLALYYMYKVTDLFFIVQVDISKLHLIEKDNIP